MGGRDLRDTVIATPVCDRRTQDDAPRVQQTLHFVRICGHADAAFGAARRATLLG